MTFYLRANHGSGCKGLNLVENLTEKEIITKGSILTSF